MERSLLFSASNLRFNTIEDPAKGAFQWIFEDKIGFAPWLEDARGLFWIFGKPGSGKSSIMKYVFSHHRTISKLKAGDVATRTIRARFFFHSRGAQYQKSYEGLMRSLLHQFLTQEPILKDFLLPAYLEVEPKSRSAWSAERLREALSSILSQSLYDLNIRLFLDALDEFDGDASDIASFIRFLVEKPKDSCTTVQACFSSRPWREFETAFHEYPQLALHQHTENDIRIFADNEIQRALPDPEKIIKGPPNSGLQQSISRRADGVFL